MFRQSWKGFELRQVSVLTIVAKPRGLQVTLKCPSEARSYTVRPRHLDAALAMLEHALLTDDCEIQELKSGPGAQKIREERKKLRDTAKSRK